MRTYHEMLDSFYKNMNEIDLRIYIIVKVSESAKIGFVNAPKHIIQLFGCLGLTVKYD